MRGLQIHDRARRRAGRSRRLHLLRHLEDAGRRRRRRRSEKVFAALEADKIEEIKITSAAGDATTLKKDDGAWQVTQPIAAKADESEVSGITSALAPARDRRASSTRTRRTSNDYGLSNPRIEVDFKAAGDKDYRKLLIGEKSPTGGDLFAKRNDEKRVFLIPAFQETTFNKDDVRPARQDGAEVRSRQGGRRRVSRRRQDAGDREGRRRLEDHEAGADASRLRIGRRAGRPSADGADEVDRRRTGDARPT